MKNKKEITPDPIDLLMEAEQKFYKIYQCIMYDEINEALLHCGYTGAKIRSYLTSIGKTIEH